jgi:hypothetical protein
MAPSLAGSHTGRPIHSVPLQVQLKEDEAFALVAYTHDLNKIDGSKEGNVYFECNRMLRLRSLEDRAKMMRTWGAFVHYLLRALVQLPNITGIVYRGYPDKKDIILREYQLGRTVQWGAFTSTTTLLGAAKGFCGDPSSAVIFKITVSSGRDINPYSFYPKVHAHLALLGALLSRPAAIDISSPHCSFESICYESVCAGGGGAALAKLALRRLRIALRARWLHDRRPRRKALRRAVDFLRRR